MKDYLNIISNYLVHCFILFTFLSIFFIFYITKLVKSAFIKEIIHLIDDGMKSFKLPFNIPNGLDLNKLIQLYSKPDQTTGMYNDLLMKSLIIVNIILWVGLIVVISILKYYNWDTLELSVILLENCLIFIFIGIIEFLFFTQVAFKFVPVEPSFMKFQLIKTLQSQSQ
jgi:hypothetical protein